MSYTHKEVIMKGYKHEMPVCNYEGKCCMRKKWKCVALVNNDFDDERCHFQKETHYGPNLYDQRKGKK